MSMIMIVAAIAYMVKQMHCAEESMKYWAEMTAEKWGKGYRGRFRRKYVVEQAEGKRREMEHIRGGAQGCLWGLLAISGRDLCVCWETGNVMDEQGSVAIIEEKPVSDESFSTIVASIEKDYVTYYEAAKKASDIRWAGGDENEALSLGRTFEYHSGVVWGYLTALRIATGREGLGLCEEWRRVNTGKVVGEDGVTIATNKAVDREITEAFVRRLGIGI